MVEKDAQTNTNNDNGEVPATGSSNGDELSSEDDKMIDKAVRHINEIANKTVYSGMVEIGEYLLETFYDNNINDATSKNPTKRNSFRKLCEREDLLISPNTFGRAIRVADQEAFLQKLENVDPKKLSYTHKAELTKIKNDDPEKINTIKECINKVWSTRQLSEHIQKKYKSKKPKISATMATNQALKKITSIPKAADFKNLPSADDYKKLKNSPKEKVEKNIKKISKEIDKRIDELTKLKGKFEKITE